METKKKFDVTYLIKVIIVLFFLFLFGKVVPPWGTLTPIGMSVLGILIGVIFMLQTGFDLGAGTVLGIFAFLLSGFYDKSGDLLKAGMGSSTVFQLITLFALCGALESSGAGEVIAKKIVTSPMANGRPAILMFLLYFAGFVGGGTVGQSGALILMYAIINAIAGIVRFDDKSRWMKTVLLGEMIATGLGSAALPYKGLGLTVFTLLNVGFTDAGIEVEFGSYMIASILFSLVFMVIMTLLGTILCKKEIVKLKDFDVKSIAEENIHLNAKQLIFSLSFVLILIYSFLTVLLPKTNAIYKVLNNWTLGFFCLLIIGILCLVRIDKKPVFSVAKDFKNGVRWNQIFAIFLFQTLGSSMSADSTGIKAWITNLLNPVFGDMGYLLFLIVIVVFTVVFTNFFANAAVGTIIATIISPFIVMHATTLGINSSVIVALVVQAANFAYWTPAASAIAPILFDQPAIAQDKKYIWTDGMVYSVAFLVVSTLWFLAMSYIL